MEMINSEFWDGAYRDNAPALLGVLRRYVEDMSITHDLLHDVFITAIGKYESYSGKGSFEGWLYRITVNTALMHLRNERNNLVETGYAPTLLIATDDEDDEQPADTVRAVIEAAGFSSEELIAAIDRLPEHHKLVFNMYVMDDFSHKQIAAELNISPGTSKSHLARARKKIQQFLYEDAMNREKKSKKKDRRLASAFLLLFPAKEHYIDRLYRDGLSDFTIQPAGNSEFLSATLEQHAASLGSHTAASVVTQTATLWGGKLSYIAVCCGTAAITGSVCWLNMSENSPLKKDKNMMNNVTAGDTLMYSPKPLEENTHFFDAVIDNGTDVAYDSIDMTRHVSTCEAVDSAKPTTTPVVIKKQIIQHQTVVVRDTIFIVE